jgi:hypothetical protein
MLNVTCWSGNKSTKGDLFHFNNARMAMGKIFKEITCFLPQFFVVHSAFPDFMLSSDFGLVIRH